MRMVLPLSVLALSVSISAAVIHVDNIRGSDANDGVSPDASVSTFARAMERAAGGDTIRLMPSMLPYRDKFVINGKRCTADAPLVIDGGGNWIIGTDEIPSDEWRRCGADLYAVPGYFSRTPKENFFLVINGRIQRMGRARLYQTRPLPDAAELHADEWTMSGDDLVVRISPGFSIQEYRIERAARDTAFAFINAPSTSIIVSNVNIKFVYNDGINLHCTRTGAAVGEGTRDIHFIDVRSDWNFDEGISAHDFCDYDMSNAVMLGNNCGVVNIDWSQCRHRGVLIADSYDVDIMCYGNGFDSFEDSYVHSTRAFKNLKWEGGTNIGMIFSNSVFYFDPVNSNAFSLWANASAVISIIASTIIDGSRKPLSLGTLGANGTVRIAESAIITAENATPDMKIGRPHPAGAGLSPGMQSLVARYYSGELTGKGFSCTGYDTNADAVRLSFNYPVDVLSLAGIRFFRDGEAFAHASLRLSGSGTSVIAENFAAGNYRIEISPMLMSVRGTNGCAPSTIHDIRMSGERFVPKAADTNRYVNNEITVPVHSARSGVIIIEAEDGALTAPMTVLSERTARGQRYIAVPQGTGLEKGSAIYRFEVSEPGEYRVWLRTVAASSDDDSLFVSIDGGVKHLSDIRVSRSFSWDTVRGRVDGKPDMASAALFTLAQGSHTLQLMSREDGLLIDTIAVARADIDMKKE